MIAACNDMYWPCEAMLPGSSNAALDRVKSHPPTATSATAITPSAMRYGLRTDADSDGSTGIAPAVTTTDGCAPSVGADAGAVTDGGANGAEGDPGGELTPGREKELGDATGGA